MNEFETTHRRISFVNLLVFGAVGLIFFAVIMAAVLRVTGVTPERARIRADAMATNYAINIHGWQTPFVQCAGIDTDSNGYVTCMISDRAGRWEQIECADQSFTDNMNSICRPYNTLNIQRAPQ